MAIVAALSLCLCLPYAPPAPDEAAAEYDGFLICCPTPPESGAAGLLRGTRSAAPEHVFGDVYWTPSEAYAQRLLDSGEAEFAEPNYIATLFETPSVPADWPRETIRTDYAEDLGLDGAGVRVAVIDSGVDLDNADLLYAKIGGGYDYLNETAEMRDDVYHGTKVAQLICGDDNGLGATGAARGCELIPLRCFASSSGGDVRTLARAITEAATVYHCDVINMSWGIAGESAVLHQAIREAYDAGAILVAASGNVSSAYPQGTVLYPAAYDEVISVGSVDAELNIASDSIQNAFVTACAPGKEIGFVSANGSVATGSGTSFAAPCVTAALALVKQFAPALHGEECLALLRERAVDLGESGYDIAYGYGLVRLDRLFDAHWERLDAGGEGEASCFSASLLRQGDGAVILACYDAQERLCGVCVSPPGTHYAAARLELPVEAVRCAALFLGNGGRSLCAAVYRPVHEDG